MLLCFGGLTGCDDETSQTDPPPDPQVDMTPDMDVVDAMVMADAMVDPDMADPDLGPIRDAAIPPIPVVAVETQIGAQMTAAGASNLVTCTAVDPDGNPVEGHTLRVDVRPREGWSRDDMNPTLLTGETAGAYQVTCIADGLGLRDATPVRWDVVPGTPARAATIVESPVINAGESSAVDCLAWDEYGNPVVLGPEVSINVQPEAAGIAAEDGEVSATTAGRYQVSCEVAGATATPSELAVLPGAPARLVAAVTPVRPVYAVGQVVTYAARVLDGFDNTVPDALLSWDSNPPLPTFGEGRFRPLSEGRYTLSVEVENTDLSAETEIVVDAGGPAISCTNPPLGAMVADSPLDLQGRVADLVGVESFTIDGQNVALDGEGRFSRRVDPDWGLNVHELVAEDAAGNVNSVFCAYFASSYVAEDAVANDTIQLHLTQTAVDDGPGDRPIQSIADLLRRMINSQALIDTVVENIPNPVVSNSCRARVPIIGSCIFRAGAEFRDLRLNGARTVDIDLVNGGFRLVVRLNDVDVDFQVTGTASPSGTINAAFLEVGVTFDVRLLNSRPDVRVRGNPSVGVGRLTLDLDLGVLRRIPGVGGAVNALEDLIFSAFEGTIRGAIVDALRDFITSEADELLSGVLQGLDLAGLALGFDVPPIAGGPATPLSLAVNFSSLNVNPQRMLIGIGSRANGPTRQAAVSAGVAVPPGPRAVVMNPDGSAAAGINLLMVNQLLHSLWRAGVFRIEDAGALLGGLPDGAQFGLQVLTPPALIGTGGGGVRLHLGPAIATVAYPGLFDDPLTLNIAAWVNADVELENGTEVTFSNLTVTDLALSIDDSGISPEARATLEREFTRIIQAVVDGALSGALPSLPVPDFALPDSLAEFGIPRGTRLGVRNLSLDGNASHLILDGDLRE